MSRHGCGCCGSDPFEPCDVTRFTLTSGTAFNSTLWEADNPANVSYVAADRVSVTDTKIRVLSPTVKSAYHLRFLFKTSSGTVIVHNKTNSFSVPSGSGVQSATLNAALTSEYCNGADHAQDKRINVAYFPTHTQGDCYAVGSTFSFGTAAWNIGTTIVEVEEANYDENWEIEVVGTAEVAAVDFLTASVNYSSSPQTLCTPADIFGDFVHYPFAKLYEPTIDADITGWDPNTSGTPTNDFGFFAPGAFQANRHFPGWSFTSAVLAAFRLRGFHSTVRDAPSIGTPYPIPYSKVTLQLNGLSCFSEDVSELIRSVADAGNAFSLDVTNDNLEPFGCSSSSTVTWHHG